jgi:hypothetical protein
MWLFSKKWRAPDPQLTMVISLTNEELPSPLMLANPAGAEGALQGMVGPADAKPAAENMVYPMLEGQYVAMSPAGGMCSLKVERAAPESNEPLSLDPGMLEVSGLTEEMLARFNQPAWRVILEMATPAADVRETVIFATRVAQRLAALGDGVVMDTCAYRFFGPGGWPVEDPQPEFDAREHVHIHIETDRGWVHTHGLVKFGRPEMEIYDVPEDLHAVAVGTLFDIGQYVITSAPIAPGETCADPNQPLFARAGTKNREGHWNDLPVLELVDIDERRKPISSGAPKALQAFAAS